MVSGLFGSCLTGSHCVSWLLANEAAEGAGWVDTASLFVWSCLVKWTYTSVCSLQSGQTRSRLCVWDEVPTYAMKSQGIIPSARFLASVSSDVAPRHPITGPLGEQTTVDLPRKGKPLAPEHIPTPARFQMQPI